MPIVNNKFFNETRPDLYIIVSFSYSCIDSSVYSLPRLNMSMSTEAIIALVALFIACVPGIQFLISHRHRIAQWWNTAQCNIYISTQCILILPFQHTNLDDCNNLDHDRFGTPDNHPLTDVPYGIYGTNSTGQFHPSDLHIAGHGPPLHMPLPISETRYTTLPSYNTTFPQLLRRRSETIIFQTAV